MKEVVLKPLYHRGKECIGIYFENSPKLNGAIRKNAGARWSQTNKVWYVSLSKENYNKVANALNGLGNIEYSALKNYLEKKKNQKIIPAVDISIKKNYTPSKKRIHPDTEQHLGLEGIKNKVIVYKKERINPVNTHVIPAMEQRLKLKGYSPSTIRTYLQEMTHLLGMLKNIPADDLTPEHMRRYMVYCSEILKLKENTLHSRINAMKFYYEQVLHREKFFWEIPRPKKQLQLPKILSEAEMGRLFKSIDNLKHKAIVFAAYSAGLRVSEVVGLKMRDVDSTRMTLFIEKAKGKKDRIVNLSPLLLDILRSYLRQLKQMPKTYLFEGDRPGESYSIRSAQQIFHDAKAKAGIHKHVSFHGLRHSFATHLLEKGVDIRYIKDILGHFDIKTTERYTHVSKRMLVNIGSPLDDLFSRGII